jgi:hypothetical protein
MKKVTTLVAAGLILSGATVSIASAQSLGVDADVSAGAGAAGMRADTDVHARGDAQRDTDGDDKASKKPDQKQDDDMNDDSIETEDDASVDMEARSTADDDDDGDEMTRGEISAAEHRSDVAAFVRSLLDVADREHGGIGAQVRAIAHEEDETGSTTAEAMTKVEERGSLRTFLFGSDYKNLGVIRSGIATTSAHIEQLTRMRDAATSASEKAELSAHIDVLASARAELDAYVTAHEEVFSIFGWFVRLFGDR